MAEPQEVDIGRLPLQQLIQMKKQLQDEYEVIASAVAALQHADAQLRRSKVDIEGLTTFETGSEVLVPLTGSLYVPGRIQDSSKVTVDIGTGYFVERSAEDATEYFVRQVDRVDKKLGPAQAVAARKRKDLQTMDEVIQLRQNELMREKQGVAAEE